MCVCGGACVCVYVCVGVHVCVWGGAHGCVGCVCVCVWGWVRVCVLGVRRWVGVGACVCCMCVMLCGGLFVCGCVCVCKHCVRCTGVQTDTTPQILHTYVCLCFWCYPFISLHVFRHLSNYTILCVLFWNGLAEDNDDHCEIATPSPNSAQLVMQLLSGTDSSTNQQADGSDMDPNGEEQSDLDFNTDGLLARQPASVGEGARQSKEPAARGVSRGSTRNKPHRSRGVTLTQRPYFQAKYGPVVGETDLEAKRNFGGT